MRAIQRCIAGPIAGARQRSGNSRQDCCQRESHRAFVERKASSDSDKFAELFLTTLARAPRREEVERFLEYVKSAQSPRQAWEDVLWALINSKEFR